ncbi:hypothetical protein AGABI1DRAFT_36555 [Agaricus bisporus var. burnettii JB137-S8]|uniref:Uncharacterized protein n=1 Tax=Agaricus bisporus var. burnettii (strain JB137-S8 / ATCC MYA-4627 / FGSC 10392) TaxID=597362 RepID=K5XDH9_AGABU|nr:uncharacterized protein AGABI1DRAFT_36555 [Agaricus bisporus var. burnettii JB137-S8]EKM81398.1 hypothetical protein AGABI1DRAFT_36555 [Agaricus bisporus var. burnettii JB137-S8]
MAQLYSNSPTVTHSLDGFTERLNNSFNDDDNDSFIKTALTGQYQDERGVGRQVFIDPLLNQVDEEDALKFTRDYDSAIGFSTNILVNGPITLHAVPHPTFSLTTSIHLHHSIEIGEDEAEQVPYHRIPNFELGTFGLRHHLHLFFPQLWSKERAMDQNPTRLTHNERSFWYTKALRPAIKDLLGEDVASQWPATVTTEEIRARRKTGQPSVGSRLIPEAAVSRLMDTIRMVLEQNESLKPEDVSWASNFFVMHTIRGVKHGYLHSPLYFDGTSCLRKLFSDASLSPHAHLQGEWWIDVGLEVSSEEGHCLQWVTAAHWKVVKEVLSIDDRDAKRITSLNSSKYSRDLSSHLTAISGFRITPGSRAEGPFGVAYVQAYTTDKTVTYGQDGIHHAKSVPAKEAFGSEQPCKSIDDIHTIYEAARKDNGSNARLEVRVPYASAIDVLLDPNECILRHALCSFTRDTWWNFRIIRLMAISRTLSLQEGAPASIRFMAETLLLTAGCLWMVNSLHARPEDGPASRDLMRATLPVTDESEVIRDILAYNTSVRPLWQHEEEEVDQDEQIPGVPYHPYGLVFFRSIMLETSRVDVPRFRCGGPGISPLSLKFFFDGMTISELQFKFKSSGLFDKEAISEFRPTNKKSCLPYINVTGAPEPTLFDLGSQGLALLPEAHDDGSDLDEASTPPPEGSQDIDTRVSALWRQFVMDITYKAPQKRGASNPSHVRINHEERLSADESPFETLNLASVFNDVWYKKANEAQWRTSFDWLFPPLGRKMAKNVQNYGACKYYHDWLHLLDTNKVNENLIEEIRNKLFQRVLKWKWIPYAQYDRIWTTSAKKPSSKYFNRWPPKEERLPAPHILLHTRAIPVFQLE